MADRIFAGLLLLVALGYSVIAFTAIKAPFQYDPVGPEGWPQILGIVAILCTAFIMLRPDIMHFDANAKTLRRIAVLLVLLFAYAAAFQPVGFILATWLFCTTLSIILGARPVRAVGYGAATGIIGYFVCTGLLDLNLPAGILQPWL
ncbi:MAG: TTT-type tricarboxylic acid uptake system permease component TctB [Roseibaca calidilacus]|uniref:TTT-type tricarboxylic acid uptake system permease component TctB n=1 Tax=Roseibaca calidilacus TaxID=1666912 RepID=A0A0P7YGY9_9RHOB|nr:tripartite tricarboxylate transporter TctB family protein [Roseibaca calidilacus]KPP89388.1 MAG: TTT-type tricarboxylic acid uptake system permease component TctB [Roseibaca calidilacus]CUX83049.1 putative tricarboxylic transport membrane protein [Roseibaca calidilacus]